MNEEKKDILDFFFDGDIIIAGAQGYTNICKILETGNYMFAINDCDGDLNVFFMHVLLKPSIRLANTINIVLRVPYGKRDIQKELHKLIQAQEIFGSDKCSWAVCLIREKVVTFRMVKLNLLLSIFLITK